MDTISSIEALEALYDSAIPKALEKVTTKLTPSYRQWISNSRFLVLSTVGPEGTDASPRGDDGPVVLIKNDSTLLLPDWRGNNRLDSLRNIVRDGRTSLMFMVPGCNNVVRVNGTTVLTAERSVTDQFNKAGKHPKTVIVMTIQEVYFQCAKALMRSKLWLSDDESGKVPTAGEFLREQNASVDASAYDDAYEDYAKPRMW